ncbi:S1C family serine protease [Sporomusa aerivorans]|uniref:S1C family serine protease n=1 Tax=Sporomusa aerivorans TaxID=204936 RepID=UPI00352B040C
MQRILSLFLILFFLPLYAANAQNVEYAKNSLGDKYYFVTESIKTGGNNIFVSAVREFSVERGGAAKKVFAVVFNTGEKKYRLLAAATLSADGKVVEKREYPQAIWQAIAGNSAEAALLSAVTRYLAQNPAAAAGGEPKAPSANRQATATGFFITPTLIVTNNHVVNAARQIEVIYNNELKAPATVIRVDPANDLALLEVHGLEQSVVPLALGQSDTVREGMRIYAVGFPLTAYIGLTAKISEGIVSGTVGYRGDTRQFEISAPIQPGNSGGPLLNENGEVIGVVSAELGRKFVDKTGIIPQNVNFAIKSDGIQNLLGNQLDNPGLPIPKRQKSVLDAVSIMELAKKGIVRIAVIMN